MSFILQSRSNFHSVLARKSVIKQVKNHYFQLFTHLVLSIFKTKTCILHHLAFLVWLPTHNFPSPITHFQPLKTHFLMTISPFSAMFFMVRRGFVYTIAVDIYAFRLAFSSILHCVLHHFTLRLASKRTAFSSILPCVQRHIALHLAPYCTIFC